MGPTCEDLYQEVHVVKVAERALSVVFHAALLHFVVVTVSCRYQQCGVFQVAPFEVRAARLNKKRWGCFLLF